MLGLWRKLYMGVVLVFALAMGALLRILEFVRIIHQST